MQLKFEKIHENATVPTHAYAENGTAGQHHNVGLDFHAASSALWQPLGEGTYTCVVSTGLRLEMPPRYHLRFASRSGLGFKRNVMAFPGTVDNSYRGELKIKLFMFSNEHPAPIKPGDKVAQGIVFQSLDYEVVEGEVNQETSRADKGFGSSG